MTEIHTGSCNCGAVRFRTAGKLRDVIYCHCSQCRKQTGHFYAATNVADADLGVEGADNITWFQSSEAASRAFCRTCGSALFWKLLGDPHISVMAGLFDKPTSFSCVCHLFVPDKGDYYEITDDLPQFERSTPTVKVAGD